MRFAHFFWPSSLVLILGVPSTVVATCCVGTCLYRLPLNPDRPNGPSLCQRWECADGSNIGQYQCCGYGKCNVLCCNCDKGGNGKVCRVRKSKLFLQSDQNFDEPELTAAEIAEKDLELFKEVNTDNSGKMSLTQFLKYAGGGQDDQTLILKFHHYDQNDDGFLTSDEMRLK